MVVKNNAQTRIFEHGETTNKFIQSSFRVWLMTLVDNILNDPESKGNADSIQLGRDHTVHISLSQPRLPMFLKNSISLFAAKIGGKRPF